MITAYQLSLSLANAKKLASLEYYSRLFNILVEWDGRALFIFRVVNSEGKILKTELVGGVFNPDDQWLKAEKKSEELKDLFILNHQ